MSAQDYFAQVALEIAQNRHGQLAGLLKQRADLQSKIAELEKDIAISQWASQRGSTYPVSPGAEIICPACWINGKRSTLHSVGGGTQSHDLYACSSCSLDFQAPF